MRGFWGSMVIGMTKCGGVTWSTSPQTSREALRTLSSMVSVIKSWKLRHDFEFGKRARGGISESYLVPWKSPVKWVKKSYTFTPSSIHLWTREFALGPVEMLSQVKRCWWIFPATKDVGFRNLSWAGDAQQAPADTMSKDGNGPAQVVGLPSQSQIFSLAGCERPLDKRSLKD